MTDKMREAVAAATKIVENPHGYTETSVLVARALLDQAAKSVPVEHKQVADGLDEDISHAMRFYSVTDLISLVRIQSEHVARLQKKLPPMRDEHPRNPRSGGE